MQRAAIARAVVHDPALVIADEPTGNLDSANGARILDALVRLNRDRGLTLLLATHAAEVAAAADRVVHMRDGRIDRIDVASASGRGHLVALFGWFILRRLAQERRAHRARPWRGSRWASRSCSPSAWPTPARSADLRPRSTRWRARRRSK